MIGFNNELRRTRIFFQLGWSKFRLRLEARPSRMQVSLAVYAILRTGIDSRIITQGQVQHKMLQGL